MRERSSLKRTQAVRLEDCSQAYQTVRKVLLSRNATAGQKFSAACLIPLLTPDQIEKLSAIADLKLTYNAGRGVADPQAIIRQRRHSKPTGVHRRNVRELWAPHGYLPPAIKLRG